jgi:hypothetical protein
MFVSLGVFSVDMPCAFMVLWTLCPRQGPLSHCCVVIFKPAMECTGTSHLASFVILCLCGTVDSLWNVSPSVDASVDSIFHRLRL